MKEWDFFVETLSDECRTGDNDLERNFLETAGSKITMP